MAPPTTTKAEKESSCCGLCTATRAAKPKISAAVTQVEKAAAEPAHEEKAELEAPQPRGKAVDIKNFNFVDLEQLPPLLRAARTASGEHAWSNILGDEEEVINRISSEGIRQPNPKLFSFDEVYHERTDPGIKSVTNLELANNVVYTGQILRNKKHGFGVQRWADGAQYTGQWHNNSACGAGIFKHNDNDSFVGYWHKNAADGYGLYCHKDGRWYDGYWLNDHKEGECYEGRDVEGVHKLIFKGIYCHSVKSIWGKHIWPDGSYYSGDFSDNVISGYGVYHWNDDRVYVGQWLACRMYGWGKFTWSDGRMYVGEYVNDSKNGFGAFIWTSDKFHIGRWNQGKQEGVGIHFKPKPNKAVRGIWAKGQPQRYLAPTEQFSDFEFGMENSALGEGLHADILRLYEKFRYCKEQDVTEVANEIIEAFTENTLELSAKVVADRTDGDVSKDTL